MTINTLSRRVYSYTLVSSIRCALIFLFSCRCTHLCWSLMFTATNDISINPDDYYYRFNIVEETSIGILCRCRILGAEDCGMWMIFKKNNAHSNVQQTFFRCLLWGCAQDQDVKLCCVCKTRTCDLFSRSPTPSPLNCQKCGPQPLRQCDAMGIEKLRGVGK